MNIVVDTNVLISAVLWKGLPSDSLKIILEEYSLVQSQSTLKEFEKVLRRKKFAGVLEKRGLTIETVIETLISQANYTIYRKFYPTTAIYAIGLPNRNSPQNSCTFSFKAGLSGNPKEIELGIR